MDDGSVDSGDLIVAADGMHSIAVRQVVGYDNPAFSTGLSAFRWLATTPELLEDPQTAELMMDHEGLFRFYSDEENRKLIWYPCREYASGFT